ncbi:hypothetical protein [Arthrobacter sp. NPDC057013]|uniref:hypothetical protein n=1 Tax=Arthrobacter sp. NPDC057013 TaxID=3345999 RepID=UPI00362A7BE2
MAPLSRKFLIDLEDGHDHAELAKTLAVTAALGLSLAATDPIPHGSDHDPARQDYAATFTRLITERILSSPSKCSPITPTHPSWSAALAGITNYTAHRLGQPAPSWTRRIKPLDKAWKVGWKLESLVLSFSQRVTRY